MNRRFWLGMVAGASLGVSLLVVNLGLTFVNVRALKDGSDLVQRSDEVLIALGNLLSLAKDGESGNRGYIITGDPSYLEPYMGAVAALDAEVDRLELLVEGNPAQVALVPTLRAAIDNKLAIMERLVTLRRDQGFYAAATMLLEGDGKRHMDSLRAVIADMMSEEQKLQRLRADRRNRLYATALVSGALVGASALAAIFAFLVLLRRFLRGREAAARVLSEQAERLRTTLASIGDAVLATDTRGFVTQMNPVAEALTGWPAREAVGRHCDEIFTVVHQTTREPQSNPATLALQQGKVVELTELGVLLARTGREVPIEDSAAPIRCREGEIVGAVLVFRDVSERRTVEVERRDTEERLKALVNATASIVWTSGAAGSFDTPQESWGAYTGQSWDEHSGFGWWQALHPEDRERLVGAWRAGQEHREVFEDQGRLWHSASQTYRRFEVRVVPVFEPDGAVREWVGMCVDVEDRRALEAERQRLAALVENSTDFIGICDLDFVPTYINRAGLAMLGLQSVDAGLEKGVAEAFFSEDRGRILEEFLPGVLERGTGEIEVRFRHLRTEEALWMLLRVFVLNDDSGQRGLAMISRDITDRRHLEDNLRDLAADLSEADQRKDEFLAMLAHELRNPLAPIRNALELIDRTDGDALALRESAPMMRRQVSHMTRLVDDLLDLSRISRGKIELRRHPIELGAVVNDAIEAARPMAESRGQRLTLDVDAKSVVVDADADRLAQVVGNLINNACKFTDDGGLIEVALEQDDQHAIVRVRDDGIGLSAAELPRVFDMFMQADSSLERTTSGLGIGLTLVKNLIELHGGEVTATSEGIGHGTEFVLRLPLFEGATLARDDSAAPALSAKAILVVDDSVDAASSLATLLELSGHRCRTSFDGSEALKVVEQWRPEIVLLDIGLPSLNGYEVAQKIRAEPWGKGVLLIALTGWGADQDRERSATAGFDGHLVKPVDYDGLIELMASLVPS